MRFTNINTHKELPCRNKDVKSQEAKEEVGEIQETASVTPESSLNNWVHDIEHIAN